MNSAIYFHPEAYSTDGTRLMGRNAAGESFLRAFLANHDTDDVWIYSDVDGHLVDFEKQAENFDRPFKIHQLSNETYDRLEVPGNLYVPGPGLSDFAWKRRLFGESLWSICGITHTTSSAQAMDSISEIISTPTNPWDALICTSASVKKNVERVLDDQHNFLSEKFGARLNVQLPELPVIPLGVHFSDFQIEPDERKSARKAFNISDDQIVVLYLGRLSFHAKAHPVAMYTAIRNAAIKTSKPVVLIECGWHGNDSIKNAFEEGADYFCPEVRVIRLDGRVNKDRIMAWAAGDIFCSFSDNIQETFGITPVEAMAAGLPSVVSDWDGYKDTIRNGVDGFRIPTVMPPPGYADDLIVSHALQVHSYDRYCGYTSALIAVDVERASFAFEQLFGSQILRMEMGEAARDRAKNIYDWRHIIKRYQDLWSHLREVRTFSNTKKQPPVGRRWPARLDPFYSFEHYASETISYDTRCTRARSMEECADSLDSTLKLAMVSYTLPVMPKQNEILEMLSGLGSEARPIGTVVANFPRARRPLIFRSFAWLLKLGLIQIET